MQAALTLIAGALFGSGLLLSGMSNPANIIAFLDFAGDWRPSLAFTMAIAILVALPAYTWSRRGKRSLLGIAPEAPDRYRLDAPLVIGSALFGLGWGLSGLCPGPALLLLTTADSRAALFAVAMVAGSYAGQALLRRVR